MYYNNDFYKIQKDKSYMAAKEILPFVLRLRTIKSCVDFGCGTGAWLKAVRDILGEAYIVGLDFGDNAESLMIPAECFMKKDLTAHIDLKEKFDLVISLEVAEHLPYEFAATFVESLCRHGDVVLFSAAIPGQGGVGHVNEQWPCYWRDLFNMNNFYAVDIIRQHFWAEHAIPVQYRQNMILYVKEGVELNYDKNLEFAFDIVNPDCWNKRAISLFLPKGWFNTCYWFKNYIRAKFQ